MRRAVTEGTLVAVDYPASGGNERLESMDWGNEKNKPWADGVIGILKS